MLRIGILGGIGPQATIDFERMLHDEANRRIPAAINAGYPPLVTVYVRHPPVLMNPDGTPSQPVTLDPRMLAAAERLGALCDLLVMPSNTPHLFVDEIAAHSGSEIVNMIDVTMAEIERRAPSRVGLVGLGIPEIYARRLDSVGLPFATSDAAQRDLLDDAILRLMEGRARASHARAAEEALAQVRAQGVDCTILGCTEIPLLLGPAAARAPDLVNPARLLAAAAVDRALEGC